MWMTALFGLLANIPGMFGDYFKRKQEIEKARVEGDLQLQLANAQLIAQQAKSESDLEITALNSTSSIFKEKVFWFLSIPVILNIVTPVYAAVIWVNFDKIPEWYQNLYCGMVAAIWGLPRAASWLTDTIQARRDYKLAKIEAVNRALFYADYKNKYGSVPKELVDKMEPVFDEMDQAK